jgi:hypothetical protein
MMGSDPQFGLFEDGDAGPLWRGFFAALDEAKFQAQALADKEGRPFFVFNLKMSCEVARLYPSTIDSTVNLHIRPRTSGSGKKSEKSAPGGKAGDDSG